MSDEYDDAVQKLNDVQRYAVDWQDKAALILAGPGSGKTTVITTRIARLLKESPGKKFRILALTFTNKAADEMTKRVNSLIPGEEGRVFIGTFHAFCSQVLRQHGAHIGIPPDFTIYSGDDDRKQVLRDALTHSTATPRDSQQNILGRIDKLMYRFATPQTTAQLFRDPDEGARNANAYQAYEDELRRLNALDFNSLLLQTHRLITTFPAIAERYRRSYPYWLIDEFQDTNAPQYRLIKAFAGSDFNNLMVVADDDQIIYEWNGASYQQIARYRNDFIPELIQLPTNYRCPNTIVAAANLLVKNNTNRTPGKNPLIAGKTTTQFPPDEHIRLRSFASDQDEAIGIARTIIAAGPTTWGNTMVLARNRSLLERLLPHLKTAGVPAVIAQRRDQFLTPHYRWLQSLLRQLTRVDDHYNFVQLVNAYNRMTDIALPPKQLLDDAQHTNTNCITEWTMALLQEDAAHHKTARRVQALCTDPAEYPAFVQACEQDFQEEAGEDSDLTEDRLAWQELTITIGQAIGRNPALDHFLQQLDLRSKEPTPPAATVRLMTIHAAKGTESDHVYLIGMAEDSIPSYQSVQKGNESKEMEEERRNCFVAITRTKEQLTLSAARSYQGYGKKPSRFLIEMGLRLPTQ